MNVFFGVPIPIAQASIFNALLLHEQPHWRDDASIRWTLAQNHHLTIHFFGAIDPALLSVLTSRLTAYLQDLNKFTIKINKLSNFPKENSNLIAAAVDLSPTLAALYRQVQQAVQDYGFPLEQRPYHPHITLCRGKRRSLMMMPPILLPDHAIIVDTLVLYQTQFTPEGSRYARLQQWALK